MATPDEIKGQIDDISNKFSSLSTAFSTLGKSLKDMFEGAQESADKAGKKARNIDDTFKGILSTQIQINKAQLKANDFLKDRRNLLIRQASLEQAGLVARRIGLKGINAEIESEKNKIEDQIKLLKLQEAVQKKIEKDLGLTGKTLEKLSNVPILNNLIDFQYAYGRAAASVGKEGITPLQSKLIGVTAAFKTLGSNMKSGQASSVLLTAAIKKLIDVSKMVDTSTGQLANNLATSYDEAFKIRQQFTAVAQASGDVAVTGERLVKAQIEINKAFKLNTSLRKEDLIYYSKLINQAKLEPEIAQEVLKISKLNNISVEDATKELYGQIEVQKMQLGLNLNASEVLKDVQATSAAIKVSYQNSTKALIEGVAAAKALGTTLDKLDSVAANITQFESSITAELQAELLIGRNLNLERARYFALTNDLVGMGNELAKQGITMEKFGRMNRIQQEATAKALGMSREDLSQMLLDQKLTAVLGKGDAAAQQKKFEALKKQVGEEEAIKRIGGEQVAKQLKQQSIQERMVQLQEKLLSLFEPLVDKVIKIADYFVTLGEKFAELPKAATILKGILLGIAAIKTFSFVKNTTQGLIDIVKNLKNIKDIFSTINEESGSLGNDLVDNVEDAIDQSAFSGKKTKSGRPDKRTKAGKKYYSRKAGKAKGGFKGGAGIAGAVGGLVAGQLIDVATDSENETTRSLGGAGNGAMSGASIGATLGSVIPGVGTAIGGAVGGLVGAAYGYWSEQQDIEAEKQAQAQENMQEPGMANGGIVSSPKKIRVGEAGPEAIVPLNKSLNVDIGVDALIAKLDQLIGATKESGNVYMDGRLVADGLRLNGFAAGRTI